MHTVLLFRMMTCPHICPWKKQQRFADWTIDSKYYHDKSHKRHGILKNHIHITPSFVARERSSELALTNEEMTGYATPESDSSFPIVERCHPANFHIGQVKSKTPGIIDRLMKYYKRLTLLAWLANWAVIISAGFNRCGVEQWQLVGLITRRSQVQVLPPL